MSDTVVSSKSAGRPAEASAPPPPSAAPAVGPEAVEEVVIRPRPGWIAIDWRELYRYRELMYFLVWRDVKIRYKQTVMGAGWAILQPIFFMIIFGIIFGNVAGQSQELPVGLQGMFPVWLFAGLLPWLLFQTAMNDGGMSLVNQQHLLTKIYLPRLFVPAATVGRALVDMSLAFVVFGVLLAVYQPALAWTFVLVPPLVVLTVVAALAIAYVLSALSVTYRDFRFIIPFLMQAWMWPTFVVLPMYQIETPLYRQLLAINPMFGIVEGYRAAIFADIGWDFPVLLISSAMTVAMFIFGLFFFRKTERRFADIA